MLNQMPFLPIYRFSSRLCAMRHNFSAAQRHLTGKPSVMRMEGCSAELAPGAISEPEWICLYRKIDREFSPDAPVYRRCLAGRLVIIFEALRASKRMVPPA